MKHYISIIVAALVCLTACQEFQPVFIGKYAEPANYKVYTDSNIPEVTKIITIAELASYYTPESPFVMPGNFSNLVGAAIKGRVSTTDQPGNFYKSFYLQDATGGIEIKLGRNGLYNDYLPGQIVYVKLDGLCLGMYGYKKDNSGQNMGMVQIGFTDPTGEYETSYLENNLIIDTHIFRGDPNDIRMVEPVRITATDLPNGKTATQASNKYIGSLVTLEGLTYGKQIFCLMYVDNNANHKAAENRIFLSDGKTWGVTTLAMSEQKMNQYLMSGIWDTAEVGSGRDRFGYVGDVKYKGEDGTYPKITREAYTVNQYFKAGSKDVQIRTSGYSKFADKEIPVEVLNGSKTINVTGILSLYQGGVQLTVNTLKDFKYSDGTYVFE